MTPAPPSTTTTTPARAKIDPTLRPFFTPVASGVGLGSTLALPSKDSCDTGTGLTLIVDSTGSGRVDSVSSGVRSGSGAREPGSPESVGSGSSVGEAVGGLVLEGVGAGVIGGQTRVQVGRGVADRDGLGDSEAGGESLGCGSPSVGVGVGVSWT